MSQKSKFYVNLDVNHAYEFYLEPTNIRKRFDSLSSVILAELNFDPSGGTVYLYINKLRNKIKMLYWHSDGFVLYYKRLEKGTFEVTSHDKSKH